MGITQLLNNTIAVCYRLGVPNSDRPRAVIVRFSDHRLRNSVWLSKKGLKGSQVTITEFLTKHRQSQFVEARKHFGIRRVWTMDGNIYIKLPNGKERLSSDVQLQTLKSQHAAVDIPAPKRKPASVAPVLPTTVVPAAPAPVSAPPAASAKAAPVVAVPSRDPVAGPSKKGDERRGKRPT